MSYNKPVSIFRDRALACANHPHVWYFDWAIRYYPIIDRISKNSSLNSKILEIGCNNFGLSVFLAHPIFGVDRAFDRSAIISESLVPIAGLATSLPIKTESCDHVVCVDTFEHMSLLGRRETLKEILRVLKPGGDALIAFPCGEPARRFEQKLRQSLSRQNIAVDWLDEHLQNPYPSINEFYELFRETSKNCPSSFKLSTSKNGSLLIQKLYIPLLLRARNRGLNLYLRALLKRSLPLVRRFTAGKCYRRLFIIERLLD